jgi:hypothetical protein
LHAADREQLWLLVRVEEVLASPMPALQRAVQSQQCVAYSLLIDAVFVLHSNPLIRDLLALPNLEWNLRLRELQVVCFPKPMRPVCIEQSSSQSQHLDHRQEMVEGLLIVLGRACGLCVVPT